MNEESETVYMEGKGIELTNYSRPDTLCILAKRIAIKDKELGIEIDLKGKISQFNKIVIDGIAFVKENKDE